MRHCIVFEMLTGHSPQRQAATGGVPCRYMQCDKCERGEHRNHAERYESYQGNTPRDDRHDPQRREHRDFAGPKSTDESLTGEKYNGGRERHQIVVSE